MGMSRPVSRGPRQDLVDHHSGSIDERGHQSWNRLLVMAPFGEASWVLNLRVARRATITQHRRQEEVAAIELAPAEVVVFFRDVPAPLVQRYAGWRCGSCAPSIRSTSMTRWKRHRGRPVFELPFFPLKHVAYARRLSRAIAEIAKTKEDENSWRT
jgi:hypothetical protein